MIPIEELKPRQGLQAVRYPSLLMIPIEELKLADNSRKQQKLEQLLMIGVVSFK